MLDSDDDWPEDDDMEDTPPKAKNRSLENMDLVLASLVSTSFVQIPRPFMRLLNPDEAIVFASLLDFHRLFQFIVQKQKGWFFYTVEKMERDTGRNQKAQLRILNCLKKRKLIAVQKKGMPAKRYIRVNLEGLQRLLLRYEALRAKESTE